MQKNNKGFVFIEAIIVIAFLATSLIVIYSAFTNVLTNEKRRMNYDDPIYLYRTYYILDYLQSYNISSYIESKLSEPNTNGSSRLLFEFTCDDQSVFLRNSNEAKFCEIITNKSFEVEHIYFTFYDTSAINSCLNEVVDTKNITADDLKCESHESLRSLSTNALNYIKTLGGKGQNYTTDINGNILDGYRILIEYKTEKNVTNENGEANKITDYYYASVNVPFGG